VNSDWIQRLVLLEDVLWVCRSLAQGRPGMPFGFDLVLGVNERRKGVRIKDRWVHDRYLRRVSARGKDWQRGERHTDTDPHRHAQLWITSESVFTACTGAWAQAETERDRARQREREGNEPTTTSLPVKAAGGSEASERRERQERLFGRLRFRDHKNHHRRRRRRRGFDGD